MALEQEGLFGNLLLDESFQLLLLRRKAFPDTETLRQEKLELVASAILLLDVHRGAEAAQASFDLNGHAAAEGLGLFHGMGRQNHRLVRSTLVDHLPQVALSPRVHSCRGLVHEQHLGVADQGDGDAELPLHPTAVAARGFLCIFRRQAQTLKESVHGVLQLLLRDTLDSTVIHKMVVAANIIPQGIHLGANTQQVEGRNSLLFMRHVVAKNADFSSAGIPDFPGQNSKSGRLPSSVWPK
mmetsp:Transcript_40713/g.97084  ORF Transcript_40713/g.97084 Transcript_40713/m.97084 type:complete len:240 (-) Transcript_40713:1088-1807(-)